MNIAGMLIMKDLASEDKKKRGADRLTAYIFIKIVVGFTIIMYCANYVS